MLGLGLEIGLGGNMKKALCIGHDADAKNWADFLFSRKFAVTVLTNSKATLTNVLKEVHELISSTENGGTLIMTYSQKKD